MIKSLKNLEFEVGLITEGIQRCLNVINVCIIILNSDRYSFISMKKCVEWLVFARWKIQAIIDVMRGE